MAAVAELVRDERTARMMLSMIADPDDAMTGRVVSSVGGVETVRLLESAQGVPTLGATDAKVWRGRLAPRLRLGVLPMAQGYQQLGFTTLIPSDDHWPDSLADLGARQPYLLWVRGATSLLAGRLLDRVTVSGMRARSLATTSYGEVVASDLARGLSDEDRVVVSGGSFGIEGAALRGILAAGGHAVVVMGNGIDQRHPTYNKTMLDTIGDIGLLVSEVPPSTPPTRQYLLARHRIMAALSGATVIVEASARSGRGTSPTKRVLWAGGSVLFPDPSRASPAREPTTCCGKVSRPSSPRPAMFCGFSITSEPTLPSRPQGWRAPVAAQHPRPPRGRSSHLRRKGRNGSWDTTAR